MKYIVFSEYKPKDFDELMEKRKQLQEEREKTPEKYPKRIFPPHMIGGGRTGKTFSVVEATEEQILNSALLYAHWLPFMKMEYAPIVEADKVMELYQKMKK